jgi:hypothetical protein
MLTFLILSALGMAAFVVAGVALAFFAIAAILSLILLPFRILFKLVFGLGGALLGLLVAPIVMIVGAVVLIGALLSALLALLVPLIPVVLLALLVWATGSRFLGPPDRVRHALGQGRRRPPSPDAFL